MNKIVKLANFTPEAQSLISDYVCTICDGVYTKPVMDPCGHVFCQNCIENHLKDNPLCPYPPHNDIANQKLSNASFIEQILGKQQLNCLYKADG